ncbi:tail fiber domain-containing protein [Tunicatimonas pelagia]|uniref:tail fiber domain-containing protein n=1 Tax=Tunicatimonas pelagia TaxID=931531 RepID=UPI00266713CD|nr:tail fiber domain-containing protein [Tunicatimonas pelagia]WKN42505.1 tail fiber domain-containing protein [Tunicatimonas pelagia]
MKQIVLLLSIALFSQKIFAQSVGVGTTSPNANAALHIVAPNNNQGVLIPSMSTEQRISEQFTANLSSQDNGLMVFDLTENRFFFWADGTWSPIISGAVNQILDVGEGLEINEQSLIINTGDTDSTNDITVTTAAGGSLVGTYPNPELAEGTVQTINLADLAVNGNKVADNTIGVEKLSGLADPTSGRNSVMITNNSNIPRWFQPEANQVLVTDNAGQITSRSEATFARETLALGEIYIGNNVGEAEPLDVSDIGNILVGNGTTLFKLDASGNGRLLVGNGTTLVSVDVMGDVSLDGTGTVQISADAIGTAEIADGTIASADLATQAVTTDKIALNAIQSDQILDESITLADLAPGSVNAEKILNGAITDGDINSGAGILVSKLEELNTGEIIFGNTNGLGEGIPTIGLLSGDASISANGILTLSSVGPGMGSYGGGGNFIESISLDVQGRVTAVTAGSPPSDSRLKENITELAYSPQKLHQLQAYSYQWKDSKMGEGRQIGLIAQEVEKVYPELVKERSDGYQGVLYQGLIPVLIEATKVQQDSLDVLSQENSLLQNRIKQLEENLNQYEEQLHRIETTIQKMVLKESPAVASPEAQ